MSRNHKTPWGKTLLLCAIAIAALYAISTAAHQNASAQPSHSTDTYGNLIAVETNPGLNSQIVDYDFFLVNFNTSLHIPNWVSWELTSDETFGEEPRGKFATDPAIAGSATPDDYKGSGYDRGHMAPAADMKWSPQAMQRCFYMTNMCPQAHSLNGGAWKKLEEKCRLWAQADSAIYIVCGPIYSPEPDEFIGENAVAVPKAFFKVICSPYANPPRGIGFIMTNGKVAGGLQAAAVTIDEVERITGHNFFSALPDDVENAIEAECKFHLWSNLKP